MSKVLSLLFFLCLGASVSFGQMLEPVKWSFDSKQTGDKEFELYFMSSIETGWHVYSQNIEEGGPIPTSFEFEDVKGFELVGKATEVGEIKEEYSKIFDMTLRYFKKKVKFVQKVKLTGKTASPGGYLTFMTCNDKTCLPPTDVDFSFNLKAKSSAPDDGSRSEVTPPVKEETTKVNEEKTPTKEETAITTPDKPTTTKPNTTTKDDTKAKENTTKAETKVVETKKTDNKKEKEPVPPATKEETESGSKSITKRNAVAGNIRGDEESPLDWTYELTPVGENAFDLTLNVTGEKGWTIYAMIQNDQEAAYTTLLEFEGVNKVETIGKVVETGDRKSAYDKYFEAEVAKFYDKASFTQRIKVDDPDKPFQSMLSFVSCNDLECKFGTLDFMLDPSGNNADVGMAAVTEDIATIGDHNDTSLFGEPVQPCGEKKKFSSLWIIFVLGFLGGMIALLTPCVFPMIPLTVSFFTKQSKTKAQGIKNAVLYGVSIIVIYVALGTTLTLIFGPEIMNRLSTDIYLNLIFFALFVIFAISFFGYFEITLPSSWANKTDRMADRGGLIGIFFMAFTLGIVSFSCTGPIIGTLLVEAGTSDANQVGNFAMGPPIGMLGFSLALALPFTLFAAFPGWLNSLPKSGGWMNTVKVTLGFLELALALKFLSIVDMTQGWGILKYELFMGLWFVIFLGLALYLFGFIKFPHDPPKPKLSKGRLAFGAVVALWTLYLATGLTTNSQLGTYNSLPALSGLAPPTHYSIFKGEPKAVDTAISKADGIKSGECPIGLDCFKDYEKGLAYAQKVKKPLLIDFTGFGCVNCRKMEEHVWPEEAILRKLKDDFVLVSLYVDDRTKLTQPYLSEVDGQKKRTVGQKWADFQAKHFKANSQPYYVLVSHEQRLLNNPRGYTPDVKEFDDFLTCGLDAFRKVCEDCDDKRPTLGLNE